MPYSYTDLYGKITFNANNGSKANVYGFNFQDQVNYQGISDLQWSSNGLGSEFILIPGNSPVLIEGNFAYSKYYISLDENASPLRESSISGGSMGFDFTNFYPSGEIKYGFDIRALKVNYEFVNNFDIRYALSNNTTDLSGYFKFKHKVNKWIIDLALLSNTTVFHCFL